SSAAPIEFTTPAAAASAAGTNPFPSLRVRNMTVATYLATAAAFPNEPASLVVTYDSERGNELREIFEFYAQPTNIFGSILYAGIDGIQGLLAPYFQDLSKMGELGDILALPIYD